MVKVQTHPPRYHDDPEEADAVSMHTTRGDYEYDDAPELPSYSDSEAAASASRQPSDPSTLHQQGLAYDPYPRVQALTNWRSTSNGKVNNCNETSIRMEKQLADPLELEKYIKNYIAIVPPNQRIRLVGTHQETQYNASSKKNEKKTVDDFDVSLSLDSYLTRERGLWHTFAADNSDSVYRGSFRKTRAKAYRQDIEIADGENPTLWDWCHDYCYNKSALKVFRVTRNVAGLETDYLHKSLERLVRSTHYHGHLDISFPIEEKHIDIYSDHWINRWRVGWQRWLFYLTFLWLITWPILFFATKWWSVYNVQWLWSRCQQDEEQQRAYKVYASISENEWLEKHKNLILSLVLEKYQGDATQFPTDVPNERVSRGVRAIVPNTGNRNVDAAVGFIQGGVSAWNTLQGRGGRDPDAWGVDS